MDEFTIEMETDSQWKSRSERIERLKTRVIPNSQPRDPDPDPNLELNIEESTQPSLIVDSWIEKFMDLQLYEATTKDDVDRFIDVLDRVSAEKDLSLPAILDSVSPLGNTLLHVAASYGREETVKLIAYHFPQLLTKQNSKGDTALHIAAKAGYDSVVKTLVQFQRDFATAPSSSDNGVTVRDDLLLRIRNDEGNTALHEALINRQMLMAVTLMRADREVTYYLNKEEKSALYLAAEAGNSYCLYRMLESGAPNESVYERVKGKSPVHAAVMTKDSWERYDCLSTLLDYEPRFIHLRDEEGRTPLHCAASMGYINGVMVLLREYPLGAFERDANGFFPIHMASIEGHVDVFQILLRHCPNPRELLVPKDQNILHVAAKSGKHNVVSYILKNPKLNYILINDKDADGNTPLLLATMACHPRIVTALTWDKRVNLTLKNKNGLTAFDAAEKYMEPTASFQQRLTWTALRAARAPSGKLGRQHK